MSPLEQAALKYAKAVQDEVAPRNAMKTFAERVNAHGGVVHIPLHWGGLEFNLRNHVELMEAELQDRHNAACKAVNKALDELVAAARSDFKTHTL